MTESRKLTVADVLARMQKAYEEFNAYINALTEKQMTEPTDAAGWTAKDHVMHLAVWEDGVNALLEKKSRPERMGLQPEMWHPEQWKTEGFDKINAIIQQQHKDMPLKDVLRVFQAAHQRMVQNVQTLSDNDLLRPYRDFDPGSKSENPIVNTIAGDTYDHYNEHTPWIAAIVAKVP